MNTFGFFIFLNIAFEGFFLFYFYEQGFFGPEFFWISLGIVSLMCVAGFFWVKWALHDTRINRFYLIIANFFMIAAALLLEGWDSVYVTDFYEDADVKVAFNEEDTEASRMHQSFFVVSKTLFIILINLIRISQSAVFCFFFVKTRAFYDSWTPKPVNYDSNYYIRVVKTLKAQYIPNSSDEARNTSSEESESSLIKVETGWAYVPQTKAKKV